MFKDKKAQTGGLITGIIAGVAGLVIMVIIALIITSTLGDANLLTSGRVSTTVENETVTFINETGNTLAGATYRDFFISGSIGSVTIFGNSTNALFNNTVLSSGNYTISNAGVITNATDVDWGNVLVTYTYNNKSTEELATDDLRANYTDGINNVSEKVPTVLLVAAVVLILAVLVFLVAAWQRMRFGSTI